jgi:TPR repeat protein
MPKHNTFLEIVAIFCEGVSKDLTEAVKWYRKAAEQELVEAQYNLGLYYFSGYGVSQDSVEAVKWFRKAAEQELAEAQYNLGLCYLKGYGISQDSVEAVKWFHKAAEQGHEEAIKVMRELNIE